jgi:hypothetical protein
MKGTRNENTRQSKQGLTNLPRPEIRNQLDSREHEEQLLKGDDSTHNKKDTKAGKLKGRGH